MDDITHKAGQGTYAYNSATDRLSSVGAHAYSYDDNGNVLSDGERALTWTSQNMVRSLNRGGQAWSLLYDADGTRVVREEASANTATYNVSPTYELRFEGSSLSEARISVLGATGRVVAEVVAERTELEANETWENRKSFVHDDHLGSTHVVTDRDGAVESSVMYGPWGSARDGGDWASSMSEAALDELPAGFTGHQPELDAGLINMRGRMYDPAVGRFMSVDPVIENALEVGTWNAYSYVQNRPLSLVDPTGLASEDSKSDYEKAKEIEIADALLDIFVAYLLGATNGIQSGILEVPITDQGPPPEETKGGEGLAVQSIVLDHKVAGSKPAKSGTYGAVKGAVDAMLCQNAECREPPPGEETEPGRAIKAGAFGLAAYSALLITGVVIALVAPEAAGAATAVYRGAKTGVALGAAALSSASNRCSSAGGGGCSAPLVPQEVSKRTWGHIFNKHTFGNFARQLPHIVSRFGVDVAKKMVSDRTFFPKEWSPAQVRTAVQTTYQAGLNAGVLNGRFSLEVSRQTVSVFISETGTLQSAWGNVIYTASDFGL